jgi:predicted Zn-dependent peptidase
MTNEKFIIEVREKVSLALGVSFASTNEIDSELKALAALAALEEWEEAKTSVKRG